MLLEDEKALYLLRRALAVNEYRPFDNGIVLSSFMAQRSALESVS